MQLSKTLKNKISKDLNNIQTIIISNLFSNISFINFGCSFFENKKHRQHQASKSCKMIPLERLRFE